MSAHALASAPPEPAAPQPIISLCAAYAPKVDSGTCAALIQVESSGNPYAIHDNVTGDIYNLATRSEAIATARELLSQEHSIDVGLTQVNSGNFISTGLTFQTAFDAPASIQAGMQILLADYRSCSTGKDLSRIGEQQAALRCALSRYNTGDPVRGIEVGYVGKVTQAAAVQPAQAAPGPATTPAASDRFVTFESAPPSAAPEEHPALLTLPPPPAAAPKATPQPPASVPPPLPPISNGSACMAYVESLRVSDMPSMLGGNASGVLVVLAMLLLAFPMVALQRRFHPSCLEKIR